MLKISKNVRCFLIVTAILLFFLSACSGKSNTVSTGSQQTAAGTHLQTPAAVKTPEATPTPVVTPTPSAVSQPSLTPAPLDKPKVKKSFPILYYHAVNDHFEEGMIAELFVSPKEFEKQMEYLKKHNYTVITFDRLKDVQNIENPVIITFDDGYEDNYTNAFPVLKKYNFNATVFMTSGFIDKPFYLSMPQIKEMNGLINFQGHSITHPDNPPLTGLKNEEVEKELTESKKVIEGLTGRKIDVFAYPIGSYDQRIIGITKKHYRYAVLNGGGLYTEGDGDYEIKRIYVPRQLDIEGFSKKIKGGK